MNNVIDLIILQGVLGSYDVLWNHEWQAKLPSKPSAALEQKIHGLRELLYGVLFIGLAWWAWHGFWAIVLIFLICVEILLTAWDFVVEDQTRILSPTERITHLVLCMVGGAYVAGLIPILMEWIHQPFELVSSDHGIRSWLMSAFGIGVLVWGIRDLISGLTLTELKQDKLISYKR